MRNYFALAVAGMVISSAVAGETPLVELGSFGPLRVGMSELQASRAARSSVIHNFPEAEEYGCFYATVKELPEGTSLMFLDGRLARIDVREPGVHTRSGAGVGTPEVVLKKIYGSRLEQKPHAYDGPIGHYLTLMSANGNLGIRFETDGTRVGAYYTGTTEAIQLKEGCQ